MKFVSQYFTSVIELLKRLRLVIRKHWIVASLVVVLIAAIVTVVALQFSKAGTTLSLSKGISFTHSNSSKPQSTSNTETVGSAVTSGSAAQQSSAKGGTGSTASKNSTTTASSTNKSPTGTPLVSTIATPNHQLVFSPGTLTIPSDAMGENVKVSVSNGGKVGIPTISYNPLMLLLSPPIPNGPQSSYMMDIARSYVQAAGSVDLTVTAKGTDGAVYSGILHVNFPPANYVDCALGTHSSSDDGKDTTYTSTFTVIPHGNIIGAHLKYGMGAASVGFIGGNYNETVVYEGQNNITLTWIVTDGTLKGIQSGFYMHDSVTRLDSLALGGCNVQYWVDNPY